MPARLDEPLTLPCGLTLPNRLCRAAMTEGIAGPRNDPNERHFRLYEANAAGGAGLVLTGNVMVDRRHLERARNIVVDSMTDEVALRRWAQSASGSPALVQLSHPGRQVTRFVQPQPLAPSDGPAVAIAGLFAAPRAMSAAEIAEVRDRFIDAGERVVRAGFAGVELHGAHGYLLDSFLDPAINHRRDEYGGSLQNRARLLVEIISALRSLLAPGTAIAVKLDSGDGRNDELGELAAILSEAGADLLEISGGNYESPAMVGLDADGRELVSEHESPFWTGAAIAAAGGSAPVILTGGFKTRAEVDRALAGDVCAMVGVGRPLAVWPDLAGRFVRGETDRLERPAPRLRGPALITRMLGAAANSGWHRFQLERTADRRPPKLGLPALAAALDYTNRDSAQAITGRRARLALAAQAGPPSPRADVAVAGPQGG